MRSHLQNLLAGQSLFLVGGGKMGMALLDGWLAAGLEPSQFLVQDPKPSEALKNSGVALNPDAKSLAAHAPDITILAIKPQFIEAVLPALSLPDGSLVVSLMAGVPLATLSDMLGDKLACIRTMPNPPAAIGKGMTGLYADAQTTPDQRGATEALLQAVGQTVWLDTEAAIDSVTAISGSGPAYIFHMAEAMASAGEQLGLSRDIARQLAEQTLVGAAAMLEQMDTPSAQLRQNVTSPGGTTQAALDVLMADDGLGQLMHRATKAAQARAVALAQIGSDTKKD
ncbi:MAG: pyrroline-5-carboxylate reductase [Rhodobiaceae bacterium]|nr:pyrroline-5-carboxylate reductase [Rhodobiaceae bacterium]